MRIGGWHDIATRNILIETEPKFAGSCYLSLGSISFKLYPGGNS